VTASAASGDIGVDALAVGLAALLTALATGLGALPFLLRPSVPGQWLGIANAAASGFMLAAATALVTEGVSYGWARVAAGAALGAAFIAVTRVVLHHSHAPQFGSAAPADAAKMLMIVLVMTVHSVTEGVGVGVSYGGGERLGVLITVAIAVHNIPEGLAVSLVLVPRGATVLAAAGWSIFSSLPQPLLAVPAYIFVEEFLPLLPFGLGFAAGAMAWMVFVELLPDARAAAPLRAVAVSLAASFALMMAFQVALLSG
jgi:zinc transporter, ZIP family